MRGDDVGAEKCDNQLASGCRARHSLIWSPTAMASKESVPHTSYSTRTNGTRILGGCGRSGMILTAALGRRRQDRYSSGHDSGRTDPGPPRPRNRRRLRSKWSGTKAWAARAMGSDEGAMGQPWRRQRAEVTVIQSPLDSIFVGIRNRASHYLKSNSNITNA